MIITITGTPGTGKTSLAKALAQQLHYQYIDIKEVIASHHLSEGFDEQRQCDIVNEKKLVDALLKTINDGCIIDGHLSHELPHDKVHRCIVTKCDLKVLEQRLKERGYSPQKIRENLDAEIFDICLTEATGKDHAITIIDTTKSVDLSKIMAQLQA